MTQLSMLITAALLFGAAVAIQFIKPHKEVVQSFLDEVAEVLVTISTFCYIIGILFF